MAKITVKTQPTTVDKSFALEREFNGPADELIEAVEQYLTRTEGQEPTPENVKNVCNEILNRRINR